MSWTAYLFFPPGRCGRAACREAGKKGLSMLGPNKEWHSVFLVFFL